METKNKLDIKTFWENGVSYNEYIQEATKRFEETKDQPENDYHEYYRLGLQRMERMFTKYSPAEEDLKKLQEKNFNGKILIITEPWCGDASQAVPVLFKFFEGRNEVKVTYRDQEPSLIEDFQTNGSNSIPIVVILDSELNVITHWGPRPKPALEFLKRFKEDPENYPREQFYVDLQTYYAKNRGKDTITEILDLL